MMKHLKTALKWGAILIGLLLLMGWAESGGAEPATKWMMFVLGGLIVYYHYHLSKQIEVLGRQIERLQSQLDDSKPH